MNDNLSLHFYKKLMNLCKSLRSKSFSTEIWNFEQWNLEVSERMNSRVNQTAFHNSNFFSRSIRLTWMRKEKKVYFENLSTYSIAFQWAFLRYWLASFPPQPHHFLHNVPSLIDMWNALKKYKIHEVSCSVMDYWTNLIKMHCGRGEKKCFWSHPINSQGSIKAISSKVSLDQKNSRLILDIKD